MNQIYKGKITNIVPDGKWTEFNKFKVSIENEDKEIGEFNFLSRGLFKKAIGDNVEYEIKNPTYNSAKLHYKPFNN